MSKGIIIISLVVRKVCPILCEAPKIILIKAPKRDQKLQLRKKTLKNRFRCHLNKFEGIDRPKRMILFSERSNLIYGNLGTNLNNVNSTTFVKQTD